MNGDIGNAVVVDGGRCHVGVGAGKRWAERGEEVKRWSGQALRLRRTEKKERS